MEKTQKKQLLQQICFYKYKEQGKIMSYLPNSIERCTLILGFDPYAYIMDKPSNLQINKMTSPYDTDYFAVGPKDTNNKAKPNVENKNNEKKSSKIFTILKTAAAVTSVVALGICGKRAFNKIGKFLGKLPGTGKIKTPKPGSTGKGGKLSNILNTISGTAKKGWGFISGKASVFGKFVSGKFHSFVNFIKKKP